MSGTAFRGTFVLVCITLRYILQHSTLIREDIAALDFQLDRSTQH